MNRNSQWHKARNVLCIRLDYAGDLLMTYPAIRRLKSAVRDRRITLLTSPGAASLHGLLPEIDAVIAYEAPWMKAHPRPAGEGADLDALLRLSAGSFDAAVIFTVYSQNPLASAFLCYLAGIPLRAAYCRENPYSLLTDWLPDPEPADLARHEVERQLALAASLGAGGGDDRMSIRIPETAERAAAKLLLGIGIREREEWITIHPGGSAPSRRYPAPLFSRVCDLLAEKAPIVFTGSSEERGLVESIRAATRARTFSAAGLTGVAELAALIKGSRLLISNNTLPVHLASATGTPVVDLYALTNPQHMPWKVNSRTLYADVDCKYCYKSVCPRGSHDCLRRVEPETVAGAARQLLEEERCTLWE